MSDSAPKAPTAVPPHNGFGSEEDSLRNCSLASLIPKRAPFDVKNFQKNDGKTLAFEACFEGARGQDGSVTPPNDERRFVVTFHVVDGTVSVYEPPVRNSGVLGGKFLERTLEAVKKPGSNVPYLARDFTSAPRSCSTRTGSSLSPRTSGPRRRSPRRLGRATTNRRAALWRRSA